MPLLASYLGAGPTQAPATAIPQPTAAATITRQPTQTPAPTQTAAPQSAYYLESGTQLDPPLRGANHGVIVLNEDTSATVEPDFDSLFWIPSNEIAQQTGLVLGDPYHATFAEGSIEWVTDIALAPGMYSIYYMDTAYSSAGPLDLHVRLNGADLQPVIGSLSLELLASQGEPAQQGDLWRNLGIFDLPQTGFLSVSAAWAERDENSIIAVDRVVIAPMPESSRMLLSALPTHLPITILDDEVADIRGGDISYTEESLLSWEDGYEYWLNLGSEVTATWESPEYMPPGKYMLAAWVPEAHTDGTVSFEFLINGQVAQDTLERTAVELDQSAAGRQWVPIGEWESPRVIEKPMEISVKMTIAPQNGEVAIDAIALIRLQ
jgi:hypothetical protein